MHFGIRDATMCGLSDDEEGNKLDLSLSPSLGALHHLGEARPTCESRGNGVIITSFRISLSVVVPGFFNTSSS